MERSYSFNQRILLFIVSIIGPIFLLVLGFTWRVRWIGLENLRTTRDNSGRVIFAFWHSRILGLLYTHRFIGAGTMISSSFDGALAAAIVKRLGFRVYRGSASRRGTEALLEMLRSSRGGDLALSVDGPRGPAEKVKYGAVTLASKSGLQVVPVSYDVDRCWQLKTWDKFVIPKPFAVLTVVYGESIIVPAAADKTSIKSYAVIIENKIKNLER